MGALENPDIIIKHLKRSDYTAVWEAMQQFTRERDKNTIDELWVVEHDPVFTLGRNGKEAHILKKTDIPIIHVDRGGQITYHGPGQLVIYFLLDLHRRKLGVRRLVTAIEDSIIKLLSNYNISANSDPKAPGVYVKGKKIAALGLRVSKGCTTHGLSINIDMDLTPYQYINPCGYEGLEVIQTRDLGIHDSVDRLSEKLMNLIISELDQIKKNNN